MAFQPIDAPEGEQQIGEFTLPKGVVHLWGYQLESTRSQSFTEMLAHDELARAERYHRETDRAKFIVSRGLLRCVLAKYADVGPADILFNYGVHGKPTLASDRRKGSLCFNLSRSGTVVVIAVACCDSIGVDIERIGTVEDFQGVSDTCFTPRERIQLASYPDPIREKAFFACWTRKEAYLKAKGIGLSMAMDRFLVSVDPNEATSNLEVPEDPEEAGRWSLTNVDTWPGYTCAVCHPKGDFQIRAFI